MNLEPIIGLEIHLQLKTKSKMFCGCSNEGENEPANTTICPICTGQPGTLPVLNQEAVDLGLLMSLGLKAKINKESIFERKNYFYPDLPKGYQISQFEKPLASNGYVIINLEGKPKKINLERLHLEEDAAKNFHDGDNTLVDFNRCGTPLVEIVTKPDITSPKEARIFLQELRLIARFLEVSSADMEKGHLRCDANISLRPKGEKKLYPKTEVKNLNSFKSVEHALEYEIKRQTDLWEKKSPPKEQSTRGWDEAKGITIEQRTKEDSSDYRYFPEPDLPPLKIKTKDLVRVKSLLKELPEEKRKRFIKEYDLNPGDTNLLIEDREVANYFEQTISELRAWLETLEGQEGTVKEIWQQSRKKTVKLVFGWLTSELYKLMNVDNHLLGKAGKILEIKITPENFAEFITIIYQNKVNSSAAQILLKQMYDTGGDPSRIIEENDLKQMDNSEDLEVVVNKIIAKYPNEVNQYKGGKLPLIKFFIGLVMRETKGKANPKMAEDLFIQKLS